MKNDNLTRLTIAIPADLRRMLKIKAAENDRTFSGEIVHALKIGSGWKEIEEKEKSGTTA